MFLRKALIKRNKKVSKKKYSTQLHFMKRNEKKEEEEEGETQ